MTRKSGMADEERGHRDYRETYGRGGGETFGDRDYPQSYAAPGAMDWRQALRTYVDGHDRGWETERKEREAAEATAAARSEGAASPPGADGSATPAAGRSGEAADGAAARTDEGARFGVPVPSRDRLRFHRSASVWRDRLPDARRLPRHTDRRLDTAPGRGGQA
jgi:hypothetical protein